MKIKLKHSNCRKRLILFFLYNIFYVLYMVYGISNKFYLGTLILFCFINFVLFLLKRGNNVTCKQEFKLGISYIITFFIVSIIVQTINSDFQPSYLISDLFRMALPIINAFLLVNTVDKDECDKFFNIFLIRFCINFILVNFKYFNMSGFSSISWVTSSSLMESSLAHDFLIMEIYYLYKNYKNRAFLCMFLCMVSMKRLSFILAPLLFILSKKIPRDIEVKRKFINILKILTILSPFVILYLYSDSGVYFLKNNFGIDLNVFMSGRPTIYGIVIDRIPYYNGLGSINNFLSSYVTSAFGTTWNNVLHNDFLRLYLETTIVGVVIFANNIVELSKKQYWHFIITCYLILTAITSHILNYFSVWVTFYMFTMFCNSLNTKNEGELKK